MVVISRYGLISPFLHRHIRFCPDQADVVSLNEPKNAGLARLLRALELKASSKPLIAGFCSEF